MVTINESTQQISEIENPCSYFTDADEAGRDDVSVARTNTVGPKQ